MTDLIMAPDGLPAEEVGRWAKEKHEYLCNYIKISSGPRRGFIDPSKSRINVTAGATYIDLFCGPGKAQVRETGEWIDGSCVAAWLKSVQGKAPFSQIYIADKDPIRLDAAYARLKKLNAPVEKIDGDALEASNTLSNSLSKHALHFVFLDPFNLGTLNFKIIENLSAFERMDILIHYSQMDIQRNYARHIKQEESAFDAFAPGWRDAVNINQSGKSFRIALFEYWKRKIEQLDTSVSKDMRLITGSKNQSLYWLMLIARHDLAKKFWGIASNPVQQSLF